MNGGDEISVDKIVSLIDSNDINSLTVLGSGFVANSNALIGKSSKNISDGYIIVDNINNEIKNFNVLVKDLEKSDRNKLSKIPVIGFLFASDEDPDVDKFESVKQDLLIITNILNSSSHIINKIIVDSDKILSLIDKEILNLKGIVDCLSTAINDSGILIESNGLIDSKPKMALAVIKRRMESILRSISSLSKASSSLDLFKGIIDLTSRESKDCLDLYHNKINVK